MSDYLWDKSGRPDPEVERLEQLLGQLRHEPRALSLPDAMTATPRARRSFFRPALATAATILLMLLAGLWFGLVRRQHVEETAPAVAREARPQRVETEARPQGVETPALAKRSEVPERSEVLRPSSRVSGGEATTRENFTPQPARRTEQGQRADAVRRAGLTKGETKLRVREAPRAVGAGRMETASVVSSSTKRLQQEATNRRLQREATRLERERAKQQLLLALRLTSDKLSFVQTKAETRSRGARLAAPSPEDHERMKLME